MATSPTSIRLDSDIKDELNSTLKSLGLTPNTYFNMAARQLIIQKRIPFDVIVEQPEPNETTRRALVEAEAKELGLIPDNSPSFDTTRSALDHLDSL